MFDLNGDLSGSDKSQLSTETTYELGYSNKIGDKFSFSVDLYNIRKQNISSVKRITPTLSLDPSKFGSEFASTFGSALASSYASLGLPSTAYSSILNQYIAVVGQAAAGLATQVPSFGYVNADQTPSDMGRVYWGHYNFGEINYWGTDIATNYDATDNLSFFASYSFLSQTEFSKGDLGEDYNSDENYHLNIPKHRVKGGFSYNPSSGLHLGLSFRYQSSMNINTMNVADGGAFWYDGFVPKRTVWDLSFGIPVSSKTRVDLTVDNVSGKKYQSFVNMPMIGQQALVTLTHSF
jgi:iron complex outermembrane receptor protein